MGNIRIPPTDAPPAYRYVTRFYRRSLRPIVITMTVVTTIWALAWYVTSFQQLQLTNDGAYPKLAPLAIAQGVMYAVACGFQVFGVVAASMQRIVLIKIYAFLCALSTLMVIGISLMRVITHFVYKACRPVMDALSLLMKCHSPPSSFRDVTCMLVCNDQWSHDSWAEIIMFIVLTVLGLLFTSMAFAYYRQALDPTSPVNSSRLPSNQVRQDGYPTHYNPPYDSTAYAPVYLPPSGPPPSDGKPPEYNRGTYPSYGGDKDKDAKDDPFSDYDSPGRTDADPLGGGSGR
ncbi:hypothetical protein JVU11DRAFT_9792 [Chiua virens]|nr:hypothetical protein JVU11DRAFT_9792 [Chiua virens]